MASAELDELGIAVFRVARFDVSGCHVYHYTELSMIQSSMSCDVELTVVSRFNHIQH